MESIKATKQLSNGITTEGPNPAYTKYTDQAWVSIQKSKQRQSISASLIHYTGHIHRK